MLEVVAVLSYLSNASFRVLILVAGFALLLLLESGFPFRKNKRKHLFANIVLTLSVVVLNFMFSGVAVFVLEWGISNDIGVMRHLNLGTPATLLIAILFLDFFGAYVSHVILHKVSVLWRVHSVHHSDTMIDVTSALRQHPFETLYRMSFVVLGALFLGIPFWMLGLYMLLLVGNGQLEHANISYPEKLERLLRQVFVTPDFHKVHHSTNADESNSNFGNIFTIWDRLFGTYESNCELKDLRYGLNDSCDDEDGGSVKDLLLLSTGE